MGKKNLQKEFIDRRRHEIIASLQEYLEETEHPMTAEEIIEEVYEDDEIEEFDDFVYDLAGDDISRNIESAQELGMELFNYFPRQSLKGNSLAEIMPFDELKKMDEAFEDFKNGVGASDYSYSLPEGSEDNFVQGLKMTMREPNKNDLYYDAMELLESGDLDDARDAEKLLEQALKMDKHSAQTYIGFVSVYSTLGDKKRAEDYIRKAYEETIKQFPKWPKRMEWGYLENREYLRAIQYRADIYADEGDKDKAIELYRLLLKLNPNDNQGVRFTLSAVYAGISGWEVNKMTDEGNRKQDWSKLDNLLKEQNAKHKFWKEPKD